MCHLLTIGYVLYECRLFEFTRSKRTAQRVGVHVGVWWDLLPAFRSCPQTPGAGVTASVQHCSVVVLGNTAFVFAEYGKYMKKISELWLQRHCQHCCRCCCVLSCKDSQVRWWLVAAAHKYYALTELQQAGLLGKSRAACRSSTLTVVFRLTNAVWLT